MKQLTAFMICFGLTCCSASAQEKAAEPAAEAVEQVTTENGSHYEQLKVLEWIIGEWVDQEESSSISTVCQWTKNKTFITRSFSVNIEGEVALEGTQVIGWDPLAKRIRSWMFDSEGGFGEGQWSQNGDQWVVKSSQVLNGGERASSINVITYVDDDTLTWRSIGREVDGVPLPNIPEVTVVRKKAE